MVDSRRYSVFIIDISRPLGGFMAPEPRLMGSCVLWLQTKSLPKEWRTMVPPCHQNIPRPPLATVAPIFLLSVLIPHGFVFAFEFSGGVFSPLRGFSATKNTVRVRKNDSSMCSSAASIAYGTKKGRMSICVIGVWVFFNVWKFTEFFASKIWVVNCVRLLRWQRLFSYLYSEQ